MIVRVVLILIAAACLAAACGGEEEPDRRVSVAAGFYPLAYAAQEVGGDGVTVQNLTPPGAEPHDVELSARDVERIRSAELVLYLGSGFQPNFERAVVGADGETLDLLRGLQLMPGEEGVDPHVWLDPLRFEQQARQIGDALDRADSADRFGARLRTLDADFKQGLARCAHREIVTSHAAFGYLADAYGLQQIALTGLSPESEPSPRALEELVEEVKEERATTVFFESLVSPRLAETVAREAGAETAALDPLEGLGEDELDAGEDYLSVMRANLDALRDALGCS